jgi:minor extracellular serine protease Vpr
MRTLLALTIAIVLIVASAVSYTQSRQVVPLQEVDTTELWSQSANESAALWFVELAGAPLSDGASHASLDREADDVYRGAAAAGIQYARGRRFKTLWNGFTVRAAAKDVTKLRGIAGVQAVYPVALIERAQLEQQPGIEPTLVSALAMTGADIAQNELGLTGDGVRVAVIDTGVDYDHPDLGGCFGPGCRVRRGYDLVGDAFNADPTSPAFNPIPTPDSLPDDCNGHGTHVAGIIGANGGITGVAPGVTFHAYRVFGCDGSTTADVMLDAMERAYEGGADVINMSIGAAFQWPQYPTAQAATRLVRRGVVVVASIGNEGATGLYSASAPGVAKDVLGVASVDNTFAHLPSFTVSPDNRPVGYSAADAAPLPPTTGTYPMARTGTATSTADACAALAPGSLTGFVTLVRRGGCNFSVKAANAQAAGAIAVVIYNNAPGRLNITVAGVVPITIPVVTITAADGVLIDGRIGAGPTTMTWTANLVSEAQPTAGLISSFSSYGLAADLSSKPDVAAPGGSVRSTLPLEQGGYGNISGTSMASPHVAGAAALMLEARPRTSPSEVMARLKSTASPTLWWGNPALGFLDNVHRQGAGLIAIDKAILSDALVSPSAIALGEMEDGAERHVLRVSADAFRPHRGKQSRRGGGEPVTYALGHEPALATGPNTFTPAFFASFATVAFDSPTVTLSGHGWHASDVRVGVTITPPADNVSRLFGGYITLTPDDGGDVLRVPYSGYNGDYQEIAALTPTANGFPWLAKLEGGFLVNQPNGATFTMAPDDQPIILFHLDHQVRALTFEVIEVATGRSFHFASDEDYIGRNSTPGGFFGFQWDGTTTKRQGGRPRIVPNGTYQIELSVLKALGDPRNPAHFERWTSPPITIARP